MEVPRLEGLSPAAPPMFPALLEEPVEDRKKSKRILKYFLRAKTSQIPSQNTDNPLKKHFLYIFYSFLHILLLEHKHKIKQQQILFPYAISLFFPVLFLSSAPAHLSCHTNLGVFV